MSSYIYHEYSKARSGLGRGYKCTFTLQVLPTQILKVLAVWTEFVTTLSDLSHIKVKLTVHESVGGYCAKGVWGEH